MDDESDNREDAKELESLLYSQVFHGSALNEDKYQNVPPSKTNVLNQNHRGAQHKRYWLKSENNETNQKLPFQPNKFRTIQRNTNMKNNLISEIDKPKINKGVSSFLKPFEPYEPLIFTPKVEEQRAENKNVKEINMLQNLNEHVNFKSQARNVRKKPGKRKKNRNAQLDDFENMKNKNKITTALQAKHNKINSIKRIQNKKTQSKIMRDNNKRKKQTEEPIDIISIEDSENDDDEVICIPGPPPLLIAIEESDDETKDNENKNETVKENIADKIKTKLTKNQYRKPQMKSNSAPVSALQSNNSSRCTSPSSTFSTDDFISQTEKSRLLEDLILNDDDLTFTETVDSFVQRQTKSGNISDQLRKLASSDMPPPLGRAKLQRKEKTEKSSNSDYLVELNCCRAVDIYDESESDISVYSKGSTLNKTEVPKNNADASSISSFSVSDIGQIDIIQKVKRLRNVYDESESDISVYSKGLNLNRTEVPKDNADASSISSSSVSDIDQIDIIQKVKRLRKRRASSNKESDKKSSDESENENEMNRNTTGLPYITKGEAVESVKKRRRASQPNSNALPTQINSSDNEFISKFNKIVQKTNVEKSSTSRDNENKEDDSNCSDETEEEITARKIAEDVINKVQKSAEIAEPVNVVLPENTNRENLKELNSDKELPEFCVDSEVFPDEPVLTKEKITEAFREIDNLKIISNLCREVSPEMDSLDITQSDVEDYIEETNKTEDNIEDDDNEIEVDGITYYRIDSHSTNNIGLCEEMYRFYNMSWGGEKFTVKGIKQKLNRKANWNINSNDRYPKFTKYTKLKCYNCCEFGHIASKCTRPRKPLICYMCGEEGHREPRCPNRICLKCGSKSLTFTKGCVKCAFLNNQVCYICKLRGHSVKFCPDKWRRYHSTITPNTVPNCRVKYNNVKYCCVCAGRGHLPEQCKYAKIYLEYQPSSSQIKSHTKSFESHSKSKNLCNSTITYNLLYRPNDQINFSFSVNREFKQSEYYGRFIKAVGLGHMFFDQPKSNEFNKRNRNKELLKRSEKTSLTLSSNSNKTNTREKEVQRNPSNALPEHQFKSPNIITEKSSNITEDKKKSSANSVNDKNNEILIATTSNTEVQSIQKDTVAKDFVFDSDSNYSFSDHFDVPKSTPNKITKIQKVVSDLKSKEPDLSKPQRTSRPMGDLPDFIPLGNSSTKEVNKGVMSGNCNSVIDKEIEQVLDVTKSIDECFIPFDESNYSVEESDYEQDTTLGISYKLRHLSENDFDESTFSEISSFGKIFLPKEYSDYLLSPDGNKFLVENSNKFNIKASIDWTSVGNVLVLEGLKEDQNNFHIKLMLMLRSLPKKLKNDILEKSLRVPRKRSVLIKFLQEDLERLDGKIGNVFDLRKQLEIYEHQHSKNGLRQGQRIRTKLNMILFGQAGLRDGKINFEILIKHLIHLIKENVHQNQDINVRNEIRDEINKSWKYIFSPLEHSNYDELVDDYYDMKRQNILPILRVRDRILNRNLQTFQISSNKFEIASDGNDSRNTQLKRRKSPSKEQSNDLDQISNTKIPKLLLNITDVNDIPPPPYLQNLEMNPNDQKELAFMDDSTLNKIENLLDKINNYDSNSKVDKNHCLSSKLASPFWSKESSNYLNNILRKKTWNNTIEKKFAIALNNATNGTLSHSDFRNILSIKNILNFVGNS